MRRSSDEESDISESEIKDYVDKPYELLKSQHYKVEVRGTLRCPFCTGKMKRGYKNYKELLQHASGVGGIGSVSRSGKQKANHLALAKYLEVDLADLVDETLARPMPTPPIKSPNEKDKFAWPWTGIVVNISVQDGDYWLKEFANSAKVHMLWDEKHQTSQATVQFQSNWDGFTKATDFEKFFEGQDHGKSAWKASEQDLGSNIYGWRARRDDYDSEGPIGEYLHKETKLRTISGIVQENAASRNTVVATLTEKIAETNQNLDKLQSMYNENAMSLSRRLEDKDSCTVILLKETRRMQKHARENVHRSLSRKK
ncbi:Factor of DNA methylation 5 [Linum perenne]